MTKVKSVTNTELEIENIVFQLLGNRTPLNNLEKHICDTINILKLAHSENLFSDGVKKSKPELNTERRFTCFYNS